MKNEKKIANEYNLKLHIQNIHELWKFENLKVYKQNFHEIEKISTKPHVYKPINEIISTLKICKIKFVKKKLLERKILKCIWKMSMKDFKKNVRSVAKISHTILDWKDILQLFMKENIQLWSMCSWKRLWI